MSKLFKLVSFFIMASSHNKKQYPKDTTWRLNSGIIKKYRQDHWLENKDNRIFSNISNNAVNKTLRKIVGRNVHAHSHRHTYASFLISKLVELLSISKILGRENMNITIEMYAYQLKELKDESNSEIRGIFSELGANLGR